MHRIQKPSTLHCILIFHGDSCADNLLDLSLIHNRARIKTKEGLLDKRGVRVRRSRLSIAFGLRYLPNFLSGIKEHRF